MPIVSVIMPAYNHEKFVGEAIESVLKQSFEDFEFIIINDGSTDNTEKVIKSYDDPRIRYYSQENIDAPKTINRGISLAEGEYISIINSDDIYHTDRLKYLLDVIKSDQYDFLFTDIEFINDYSYQCYDPAQLNIAWIKRLKFIYNTTGSLKSTLLFGNLAATSSNFFFKTDITSKVGFFGDNHYTHDYEFLLKCLLKLENSLMYLDESQYLYYRIHENNTIREKSMIPRIEVYNLLSKMAPEFINDQNDIIKVQIGLNYLKRLHDVLAKDVIKLENSFAWKATAVLRNMGKRIFKS